MANLKQVLAALAQKQADLDMMDDELLGMPEMSPEAPADMATSSEFDLLSEKREELETEIREMREGVELVSQWEKFKDGPWSEQIKGLLGEIDIEISDIAGGEVSAADELGGMAPMPGADPMAPPPPVGMAAPAPMPEPPPAPAEAPAPEIPAAEPAADAAPLEPPMASAKSAVGKKNSYQAPVKKGVSARSDIKKEGSNMANSTPAKASVQEKLAEVKSKREAIRREAQQRVAAAWTIAKTMLPTAPAEVQKSTASSLLQNSTRVLNSMLRQTAKNAHYSKLAETFKQVHKVELNDHLEDPSVLAGLRKEVESEIKGDPKNAAAKKADDRKDAGPQLATFDDGRCYPSKDTTPAQMHADSPKSQTEADHRPMDTVNKSEGDKAGKEASAKAAPKTAKCECEGECKCATKEAAKKHGKDCDCKECKKKDKKATVKTADPVMEAPVEEAPMDAPPAEAPIEEAPMEEAPIEEPPAEMPMDEGAEGDTAGEVISDEKKMVVEEKIEEAQDAIKALEQEILQEGDEELNLEEIGESTMEGEGEQPLDLAQVFNEDEMEEKVSALANEGDEHLAGNGEEYFSPSAAESMEASLDDNQVASMDDFFSLRGSDSDPLAHLIAGEIKSAADVAGMTVIPSFTGEAAKHFESDSATGESRDNENDHDGDLFAEAIEDQKPEDGGFKRVKQDETNELQAPKSAKKVAPVAAKAPVIKKLKNVTASEQKPFDIAGALLGNDEF